jgi:hypothetical protein
MAACNCSKQTVALPKRTLLSIYRPLLYRTGAAA